MRREQTLEEISDGKLYDSNDMVKADCQDCAGCHDCCEGMGDSVVLDPMDVYRLCTNLGKTPQELANHVNIFCKAIADAGYRPMLYGNNEWLTKHIDLAQIPYDIWYARYGTNGDFANRKIWQFKPDP